MKNERVITYAGGGGATLKTQYLAVRNLKYVIPNLFRDLSNDTDSTLLRTDAETSSA